MDAKTPSLSVVVLCYRSADTIASFVNPLVASLNQHEPDWEVVLVGNFIAGSGDRTPDVVKNLAKTNPRIRSVTLVKEGMMGWDMISGLKSATGKVVAIIDGDGQMPHEDVIRTYKMLKDEGLDLVKTYRAERDDGSYRKFISTIYNIIFKILFPGLKNRDINSKPKTFTREVYERMDLHSDGWFIDAEIMIQARRLQLKIGEIPTGFRNMDSRPSFVKPRAIFEFLGNLVWYRILEFRYWFK